MWVLKLVEMTACGWDDGAAERESGEFGGELTRDDWLLATKDDEDKEREENASAQGE